METNSDAKSRILFLFVLSCFLCGLLSFIKTLADRSGFSFGTFCTRLVLYFLLQFIVPAGLVVYGNEPTMMLRKREKIQSDDKELGDVQIAKQFTVVWSMFVVITIFFCIKVG